MYMVIILRERAESKRSLRNRLIALVIKFCVISFQYRLVCSFECSDESRENVRETCQNLNFFVRHMVMKNNYSLLM